jgi:hypothetical protein
MVVGVLEELLPRVYAGFGLGEVMVSLLAAAALLASIFLLSRLEAFVQFSLRKQILVMCAALVLLIAGLYWRAAGAAVLILLFNLIFHLFRPVFMHHVQEAASGEERATIGSIPGLAAGGLGALAYAGMGLLASISSELFSIGVYAAIWLVVMGLLAYRGGRYGSSGVKQLEPSPE